MNEIKTPIWKEQTIENEVNYYNKNKRRVEKIKIQMKFTTDHLIIYQKDGIILRAEQIHDISKFPEMLKNMEQIQSHSWYGQYDQKIKKNGKWIPSWDQKAIMNSGGYSQIIISQIILQQRLKARLMDRSIQKLFKVTSRYIVTNSMTQIYEAGEYMNDVRIGKWKYFQKNKNIEGGLYNAKGKKIGKWIEFDEGFYNYKQITFIGEYNINGMKVGIWDIMYCNDEKKEYKKIGGGSYDQEGNQKKIGKWVELDEKFYDEKQVTYSGQYNINGMKVGRWDIMYYKSGEQEYKQIGGGSYDQEGNQKKIGKWLELDEGFYTKKLVTYSGQYNINGMKVGRWDIMYDYYGNGQYEQIGGGSYDLKGNQKKIGKWVEFDQEFDYCKFITYNGEYNQSGMKVGRWDIMYDYYGKREFKQIGGGSYDEEGNQKKIGKWVELSQGFQQFAQVTYIGEYNTNGMKLGKWDIMFEGDGGGLYDQEGNQNKIGQWVELDEEFRYWKQITYYGEYNKNNMKIGRWDIWFNWCGNKQIGGGSYDQEGNQKKIGKWVELYEGFCNNFQITSNGEYNINGLKTGIWVKIDIQNKGMEDQLYN